MNKHLELAQSNKLLNTFIDYLFWILVIVYTDPGGILTHFNNNNMSGSIKIYDIVFVLLSICYLIIPKSSNILDENFIKIKRYLIFLLIYFFLVFGYLVPIFNGVVNYSFQLCFVKSRTTIYNILLFFYLYEFFKRRGDFFIQIFLFSSITILFLLIIAIILNIDILPVWKLNRGFINTNRNLLFSYGLMPLLVPLGAITIIFKLRFRYKSLVLIGFSLMSIAWLLSITRRDIIGIIIYFILAILINTYITKNYKVFFNTTLKSVVVIFILSVSTLFIFPKIFEAVKVSMIETVNIIETGKESSGYKDERLGLRPFIVSQFLKYPTFGTGFDDRWRGGPEGEKQGYKASDYPFLSALAMFGIGGLLFFLPLYIIIIRILIKDLKYLKQKINKNGTIILLLLLCFITYFIYDFLQYINYFRWLSNSSEYLWYFPLSFYLSVRQKYFILETENTVIQQ